MQILIKILGWVFLGFIKLYQWFLSPILGASCRFTPSCSQYGIESISKYGPFKGSLLTLRRMARCHPWGDHGHDPVP